MKRKGLGGMIIFFMVFLCFINSTSSDLYDDFILSGKANFWINPEQEKSVKQD